MRSKENDYVKEEEDDEYVIHEIDESKLQISKLEVKKKVDTVQVRKEENAYGHYNIYLQQVPRRSKCNVQCSFEGVYENESETDFIPSRTQEVKESANIKASKYFANICSNLPMAWKIILGIIGLGLISTAVTAWIIALTKVPVKGKFH